MKKKHLFIIDPIEQLNLELDSSLKLAFALSEREHACFYCYRDDLYWLKQDATPAALVRPLVFDDKASKLQKVTDTSKVNLREFNSIQMRLEPPFDLSYIAITWLLDSVCQDVLVVNHPGALRRYNEKLAIFSFPEDCDRALVSSSPQQILDFVKNSCDGDAIIKPLDLYGGRGVERFQISSESDPTLLSKIAVFCKNEVSLRLVQPFNHAIFEGEVRAFAVAGKPVAWCLKIPAKGSYMANTGQGARLEAYTPSKELHGRIEAISQKLWADGIAFAGYDIIGQFVSEINITSPRLLVPPGQDEGVFYGDIADWLARTSS